VPKPRLLAVASAVDLDFRYGCTPAWWQLWKGLYEQGVDLVVTPYRGRPVESPWWRTAPNPLYREAETFARARDAALARAELGQACPCGLRRFPALLTAERRHCSPAAFEAASVAWRRASRRRGQVSLPHVDPLDWRERLSNSEG